MCTVGTRHAEPSARPIATGVGLPQQQLLHPAGGPHRAERTHRHEIADVHHDPRTDLAEHEVPDHRHTVVQATPLYHGVAMVRDLMLGQVGAGIVVHIGYLVAMGALGTVWTAGRVEKLLLR